MLCCVVWPVGGARTPRRSDSLTLSLSHSVPLSLALCSLTRPTCALRTCLLGVPGVVACGTWTTPMPCCSWVRRGWVGEQRGGVNGERSDPFTPQESPPRSCWCSETTPRGTTGSAATRAAQLPVVHPRRIRRSVHPAVGFLPRDERRWGHAVLSLTRALVFVCAGTNPRVEAPVLNARIRASAVRIAIIIVPFAV